MSTLLAADTGGHLFWIAEPRGGDRRAAHVQPGGGPRARPGPVPLAQARSEGRTRGAVALATIAAIALHADHAPRRRLPPPERPGPGPSRSSAATSGSGPMTLGIVSGWALIALGLGYYVRGRIGVARWRVLHRFTALAWLAALAHSLGEGTDAGQAWFLAAAAIPAVPALALLVERLDAAPGHTGRRDGSSGMNGSELLARRRARIQADPADGGRADGGGVPRAVRRDLRANGRWQRPGARGRAWSAKATTSTSGSKLVEQRQQLGRRERLRDRRRHVEPVHGLAVRGEHEPVVNEAAETFACFGGRCSGTSAAPAPPRQRRPRGPRSCRRGTSASAASCPPASSPPSTPTRARTCRCRP